jgi:hypothetical protein
MREIRIGNKIRKVAKIRASISLSTIKRSTYYT